MPGISLHEPHPPQPSEDRTPYPVCKNNMEGLQIILKKGKDFLGNLSSPSTVQRSVCPRETLIGFIDEAGHLVIKGLSNDLQKAEVDELQFVRLV